MNAKSLGIIFSLLIVTKVHSQLSFIGNWRSANWNSQLPDLTIRPDSTFLMRIDTTERIVRFQGHNIVDCEYKGVWTLPDKKHLTLWSDSRTKMVFPYKIIRLTQNKMILRFTFNENKNGLGTFTYIRL